MELRRRRGPGRAPGARAGRRRSRGHRGPLPARAPPDERLARARAARRTRRSRWWRSRSPCRRWRRTYLTGRPRRARGQIERVLKRGFDVIHFHNPSLLGAPGVLEMGDALKLYTAHEQWLLCPGHTLLRAGGRVCEDPPCATCELVHTPPAPALAAHRDARAGPAAPGLPDRPEPRPGAAAQQPGGHGADRGDRALRARSRRAERGRGRAGPLLPLRRAPGAGEGRREPDRLVRAVGAGRPGDRRATAGGRAGFGAGRAGRRGSISRAGSIRTASTRSTAARWPWWCRRSGTSPSAW